jgi:hypothetical protein
MPRIVPKGDDTSVTRAARVAIRGPQGAPVEVHDGVWGTNERTATD